MIEAPPRNSLIVKTLVLSMIAICALAVPTAGLAQTSEPVVMQCTWDSNPAIRLIVTLDMAGKTVAEEKIIPNPGGQPNPVDQTYPQGTISQITDQKVTWTTPLSGATMTYTLDRYTGRLTEESSVPSPQGITTVGYSCQKQQKQF